MKQKTIHILERAIDIIFFNTVSNNIKIFRVNCNIIQGVFAGGSIVEKAKTLHCLSIKIKKKKNI